VIVLPVYFYAFTETNPLARDSIPRFVK
jgi:hypothetical protein